MAYLKKIFFRDRFRTQMSHPASQLWVLYKDYFTILHNESSQRDMGILLMVFLKKILFSNLVILEQKWGRVLLTLNLLLGFFINFTQ